MKIFVPYNAWGGIMPRQLLMQLKLTIVLLFAAIMHVNAGTFSQKVTLSVKDAPLQQVFKLISDQTGYAFIVNPSLLHQAKPVTIAEKDAPLNAVLDKLIANRGLKYVIRYKTIVLTPADKAEALPGVKAELLPQLMAPPPTIDINGRVIDKDGKPVVDALIKIKNTKTGTLSDDRGLFTLQAVETGATLVVSSVNIETLEVTVPTAPQFLTLVVAMKVKELSSFAIQVNTGFQKLSKERATGAFGKPDMDVVTKRTGTMDIISRLEGQVPGLQLTIGDNNSRSNTNGNGVRTRRSVVRGASSVALGSDPLYVLNGVVVEEFSAVNIDDIEDISILKDAAAAAIWGSRAANGVIVITTRSGARAARPIIGYTGFLNYSGRPDFSYGKLMNSRQFIQSARETFDPVVNPYNFVNYDALAPHELIQYQRERGLISGTQANQKLDSLASIDNLSQISDLFYRPAITHNHTLSVSGGSNMYSFYGSLGYTGSQSAAAGDKSDAYKLNLTQSITAGNRFKLTISASVINTVSRAWNNVSVSSSFLPYQLFKDAAGHPIQMNYMTGYPDSVLADYQERSRINLGYTPLNETSLGYSKRNNLNINVTAGLQLKLWKGLSFSGTYGYQKAPGTAVDYRDNQTIDGRKQLISFTEAPTAADAPVYHLPRDGGRLIDGRNDQRNWTVRNQLVYDGAVRSGKDRITLQAGSDVQEGYNMRTNTTLLGYNDALGTYAILDYQRYRNGVPGTITGTGYLWFTPYEIRKQINRFISYFGLASYTFNGKYSLDASWRQDYSNQFGKDLASQNKPIWSLGGKWRISEETFLKKIKWINDLGLRTTYGITGNSPYVGTAARDNIYESRNSTNRTNLIAGDGLSLITVANNSLSWEATRTLNIGLDFTVLNRRLSGSVDVYRKNTTDLIGDLLLNPFTGRSNLNGNVGNLINKGVEIALRSENIRGKKWSWSTNLTFAYNYNKLQQFSAPSQWSNTAAGWVGYPPPLVGYSTQPLFAWRYAGLDNMGDPLIYKADKTITKSPQGADLTTADVAYMGNLAAPVSGGISNTFRYKNISLALNAVYNLGAVMRKDVNTFYSGRLSSSTSFSGPNLQTYFLDRWKKPGDELFTNIPSFVADYGESYDRRNVDYYMNGDINVVSASFIKLRDITLTYEFAPHLLQSLNMQQASVFVQTTNFMLWKANDAGIDPEVPRSAGTAHPGHGYSIGVNLSF